MYIHREREREPERAREEQREAERAGERASPCFIQVCLCYVISFRGPAEVGPKNSYEHWPWGFLGAPCLGAPS